MLFGHLSLVIKGLRCRHRCGGADQYLTKIQQEEKIVLVCPSTAKSQYEA